MLFRARATNFLRVPFFIFLWSIVFLSPALPVQAYLINFESVADNIGIGVPVTNQFSGLGVTFDNATGLTAGLSLNEFDFPPRSGSTVVSNLANGVMTLFFSVPVTDAAGYFTYNIPNGGLLFSAYDQFGALLGTVSSLFLNNTGDGFGDAGSSPNEQLQLSGLGPISRIVVDPNGGDFTLDDFSATPAAAVPEPGSVLLMASGLAGLAGWRWRGRNRKNSQS